VCCLAAGGSHVIGTGWTCWEPQSLVTVLRWCVLLRYVSEVDPGALASAAWLFAFATCQLG
jgi:hypothetical protein